MNSVVLRDLIVPRVPPPKRQKFCSERDGHEHHLTEAAVMLAFASYLFLCGAIKVELHPDGEHGKRFPIRDWLLKNGFTHSKGMGKTAYGGIYQRGGQTLDVSLKPGLGDVVTQLNGTMVVAECKGGVINSKHSGIGSRLTAGLCEAVGQLFKRDNDFERHVAVVPDTPNTSKLGSKMAKRANAAGIEIALVDQAGRVRFLTVD